MGKVNSQKCLSATENMIKIVLINKVSLNKQVWEIGGCQVDVKVKQALVTELSSVLLYH